MERKEAVLKNKVKTQFASQIAALTIRGVADLTAKSASFEPEHLEQSVNMASSVVFGHQPPRKTDFRAWNKAIGAAVKEHVNEYINKSDGPCKIFVDEKGKTHVTTKELIAAEKSIIESATALSSNGQNGLPYEQRQATVDNYTSWCHEKFGNDGVEGHKVAIDQVLQEGDLKIIDGPPGSGKTSVLEAMASGLASTKEGLPEIIATGSTDKAASAMYSDMSGAVTGTDKAKVKGDALKHVIKSMNSGKVKPGTFVVVDEAGMLGTREMADLMKAAQKAQSKLILMGDAKQLPPNVAGEPYRLLTDTLAKEGKVVPSLLTQTLRQAAGDEKVASESFRGGNAMNALQIYKNKSYVDYPASSAETGDVDKSKQIVRQPISFETGRETALDSVANDYLDWAVNKPVTDKNMKKLAEKGKKPKTEDAVAITIGSQGAITVNKQIREGLIKNGLLGENQTIQTPDGPKEMAVGDKILFGEKLILGDKKEAVNAGSGGAVEGVFKDGTVAIRTEDKRLVKVPAKDMAGVNHAYCVDVRTSQGMSRDRAFVAIEKNVDLAEMMVAMTRHKNRVALHINKATYPDLQSLAKDASKRRDNVNVAELGTEKAKTPGKANTACNEMQVKKLFEAAKRVR